MAAGMHPPSHETLAGWLADHGVTGPDVANDLARDLAKSFTIDWSPRDHD
jgi:hypothetical protein